MGEGGAIGAPAAVVNAVNDALQNAREGADSVQRDAGARELPVDDGPDLGGVSPPWKPVHE